MQLSQGFLHHPKSLPNSLKRGPVVRGSLGEAGDCCKEGVCVFGGGGGEKPFPTLAGFLLRQRDPYLPEKSRCLLFSLGLNDIPIQYTDLFRSVESQTGLCFQFFLQTHADSTFKSCFFSIYLFNKFLSHPVFKKL